MTNITTNFVVLFPPTRHIEEREKIVLLARPLIDFNILLIPLFIKPLH